MRFSIGLPAYKGDYFLACVESILNQSYTDFELLVLDDCSPSPVIKDFINNSQEDTRIKCHRTNKNTGAVNLVDNWNFLLNKAEGEFIMIMGDDDLLEPDYLKEFDNLIKNNSGNVIFHCRSKIINAKNEVIELTPSWPEFENVYDNMYHRLRDLRVQFISDFIFHRKTLINKGGFYKIPLAWASDDITSYLLMQDKGIVHTNKLLLNYRRSDITISESADYFNKMKAYCIQEKWFIEFFKTIPKNNDELITFSLVKEMFKIYFLKAKTICINKSFRNKPLAYLKVWRKEYKNIGVSKKVILKQLILASLKRFTL